MTARLALWMLLACAVPVSAPLGQDDKAPGRKPGEAAGAPPLAVQPQKLSSPRQGTAAPSGPPYTFTAPRLTITGTGALAEVLAFAPLSFKAPELTVTGTGALSAVAPFTPLQFRAPELTLTGTGKLR